MSENHDAVKTFFNPHPGFVSGKLPLPPKVKMAVDALDGRHMPLREAIAKIRAVTSGGVSVRNDEIILEFFFYRSDAVSHRFHLIRFR